MSQKIARRDRAQQGAAKSIKKLRRKGWSTNAKVTVGLLTAVVVGLAALFFFTQRDSGGSAELVRADSHRLASAADGKVTVVEFLDYQCPSCGAAYPQVEQILDEYGDRITYVVRNFPLPMHEHADTAARAAEAAALQGKYKQMYDKLFQNQSTWSLQPVPRTTFEEYAEQLGLDMEKFKSDMDSDAVAAKVGQDVNDGNASGVSGTPTFFVNGTELSDAPSYENLKAAIDKALTR